MTNYKILGYIFDIVAKVLIIRQEVKLNDLPRMADFALWCEAIARAMGYRELEFINTYYDNIGRQNSEAIDNHPLGQAICRFVDEWEEDQNNWEGATGDLLERLDIIAQNYKINTNHKSWPKSVNYLTRRLNLIRSNLLEGPGISVTIDRVTSGNKKSKNTSIIRVEKIGPLPPLPPLCPPDKNWARNEDKISGDTLSTMQQISPPEDEQPHNEKGESGDSGGDGDIDSNRE